jgi:hypothetical protein
MHTHIRTMLQVAYPVSLSMNEYVTSRGLGSVEEVKQATTVSPSRTLPHAPRRQCAFSLYLSFLFWPAERLDMDMYLPISSFAASSLFFGLAWSIFLRVQGALWLLWVVPKGVCVCACGDKAMPWCVQRLVACVVRQVCPSATACTWRVCKVGTWRMRVEWSVKGYTGETKNMLITRLAPPACICSHRDVYI